MKKHLLSLVVSFATVPCLADDVPALAIGAGGTETSIELASISNIKYTATDMVVNLTNGETKTFALDDVTIMTFKQVPSAIKSIISEASANDCFIISDIAGKVIVQGKAKDSESIVMPDAKGLYIITVGDKSRKILVR